mgnify:CR=1 FL=1
MDDSRHSFRMPVPLPKMFSRLSKRLRRGFVETLGEFRYAHVTCRNSWRVPLRYVCRRYPRTMPRFARIAAKRSEHRRSHTKRLPPIRNALPTCRDAGPVAWPVRMSRWRLAGDQNAVKRFWRRHRHSGLRRTAASDRWQARSLDERLHRARRNVPRLGPMKHGNPSTRARNSPSRAHDANNIPPTHAR